MVDCQVAGNITVGGSGCIISISTNSSVESKLVCGETKLFLGATIETVTITGYATMIPHKGESGRAGYSSPLTRKYDCDIDSIRFLCNGEGSSYVMGNVGGLARVKEFGAITEGFSASAASGPSSVCLASSQTNGFGMSYNGLPISFSSGSDSCTMIELSVGATSGNFYLQSFSLDMPSGQVPVASYTVTRVIPRAG